MCGLVAIINKRKDHSEAEAAARIGRMTDIIRHRGPDDHGALSRSRVALGFRRLAILDLSSAGHQPMSDANGRYSLVFNGEIYNYVELRKELERKGVQIRSSGDTEVLLQCLALWGEAVVPRLVGMFAFVFVDWESRQILAARDHFGIKPLFFAETEEALFLASEIKSLVRTGEIGFRENESRIARFLGFGRTESVPEDDETYFAGVRQLLPGQLAHISFSGEMRLVRYWNPATVDQTPISRWQDIGDAFDESMRLHLRADVPVGIMLSGGIDSVSIACRLVELAHAGHAEPNAVQSFSFLSSEHDEATQLTDTIGATGLTPHMLPDTSPTELFDRLSEVLWAHDEPFHSPTVLVGYRLYELAANCGIRVVLSGQGADEVFAGYPVFAEQMMLSLLRRGRIGDLTTQLRRFSHFSGVPLGRYVRRLLALYRSTTNSRSDSSRLQRQRDYYLKSDAASHLCSSFRELAVSYQTPAEGAGLREALDGAIAHWSLPQYLRVEDRNAMAHSVESRVPFLDHRLVDLALRLPLEDQIWDGWNKIGLRRAMRDRIPQSVSDRRVKFGFPTSARDWFRRELHPMLRERLSECELSKRGYVSTSSLHRLLDQHVARTHDNSDVLFAALQVNDWLEQWRAAPQS